MGKPESILLTNSLNDLAKKGYNVKKILLLLMVATSVYLSNAQDDDVIIIKWLIIMLLQAGEFLINFCFNRPD